MSMELSGSVELREDIARMADLLRTSGENGSRACSWILQNAAQPVLEQMLHNASTDPKRRTGTLLRSIKIGRVEGHCGECPSAAAVSGLYHPDL